MPPAPPTRADTAFRTHTPSPPKVVSSPPRKESPPKIAKTSSPPVTVPPANPQPRSDVVSPPSDPPPPARVVSPPKRGTVSPPKTVQLQPVRTGSAIPPKKDPAEIISPPISTFKLARANSKADETKPAPKAIGKEPSIEREHSKIEKQPTALGNQLEWKARENSVEAVKVEAEKSEKSEKAVVNEESNGVGDKIKKFEKAAEDASASAGRMSRPGSVRGRSRTERIGSDTKEDLPPPATPFKDNVHFELNNPAPPERTAPAAERSATVIERQQSLSRGASSVKWQRADGNSAEGERPRPEPQRIIKPEFKPIASPVDVTIRSPSLGAKIPDQFPSHGTAFRNVASPDPARPLAPAADDGPRPGKLRGKEKYSVSKGSSYFTRGSEEIWLVKKKDIEEIEERVLDSFRRAGGGGGGGAGGAGAARAEGAAAPATGMGAAATLGRRRAPYARSESLDPGWAGARAHTLKRQASVACTCHERRAPRARAPPAPDARPRSRSHGDDAHHVLDKYETLV